MDHCLFSPPSDLFLPTSPFDGTYFRAPAIGYPVSQLLDVLPCSIGSSIAVSSGPSLVIDPQLAKMHSDFGKDVQDGLPLETLMSAFQTYKEQWKTGEKCAHVEKRGRAQMQFFPSGDDGCNVDFGVKVTSENGNFTFYRNGTIENLSKKLSMMGESIRTGDRERLEVVPLRRTSGQRPSDILSLGTAAPLTQDQYETMISNGHTSTKIPGDWQPASLHRSNQINHIPSPSTQTIGAIMDDFQSRNIPGGNVLYCAVGEAENSSISILVARTDPDTVKATVFNPRGKPTITYTAHLPVNRLLGDGLGSRQSSSRYAIRTEIPVPYGFSGISPEQFIAHLMK